MSRPSVSSFAGQVPPSSGRGSPSLRPNTGPAPGWAPRLFHWLFQRPDGPGGSPGRDGFPPRSAGPGAGRMRPHRANGEMSEVMKRLISDDRYAFALLQETVEEISDEESRPAWDVLRQQMALVPAGTVELILPDGTTAASEIGGFFLDRHAVSNRQYRKFIQSGGYDSLEIWPQEVWPSVSRFTDRKGRPGPRNWENGKFPQGLADHPVVGICWYEAMAYARWVGKRLPTAAEWQKAGGWPEQLSGGKSNRYPWGDLFDPERDQPPVLRHRPDRARRRLSQRHDPQRHLPDDGQRLGMARRSPGGDPLPRKEQLSFPGSPCAGSSAGPSTPTSPARRRATSSPVRENSTAATTSGFAAPSLWISSGPSPDQIPVPVKQERFHNVYSLRPIVCSGLRGSRLSALRRATLRRIIRAERATCPTG